MQLPSIVSAVVFDCDGVLLDTESSWSRAEAALFAEYGFGFGPAEKDLLIGRTLEAACDNMAVYIGQARSRTSAAIRAAPPRRIRTRHHRRGHARRSGST